MMTLSSIGVNAPQGDHTSKDSKMILGGVRVLAGRYGGPERDGNEGAAGEVRGRDGARVGGVCVKIFFI